MVSYKVYILTPKTSIKALKTVLEAKKKYDKRQKIIPFEEANIVHDFFHHASIADFNHAAAAAGYYYLIPTTETIDALDKDAASSFLLANMSIILNVLGIGSSSTTPGVSLLVRRQVNDDVTQGGQVTSPARQKGELLRSLESWLRCLPSDVRAVLPVPIHSLVASVTPHYTLYLPLLLLPENTFQTGPWPDLVKGPLAPHLPELYRILCRDFHVTHVATHGAVHVLNTPGGLSDTPSPNLIRSPTSLRQLHGSLGSSDLSPSESNFPAVLWVSHTQYGVMQIWAPLYTMFSRGNIREKERILNMLELDAKALGRDVGEISVVDLYSGIGYFAFFYLKRGVGKVLCWEFNGWSVEGMRRGAEANGWRVKTVEANEKSDAVLGDGKLIVFQEDNRNAAERIKVMRNRIPPVRHVNCGLIPTSIESWEIAATVLDPIEGGWIHVHENINDDDLETKISFIVMRFQTLLDIHNEPEQQHRIVECRRVNRVKSYGPHITHYVLDIHVGPPAKEQRLRSTTQKPSE